MRKEQKAQVDRGARRPARARREAIYAVDYRGLSVPQAAELRASLREHDASFRIVKNTLTLRAADQAGVEEIKELVAEGPTALTFVRGDAALAAKALDTFSRQADVLELKGGLMERPRCWRRTRSASSHGFPRRDVLIAQFAGVVASPDHRTRAGPRVDGRAASPWRSPRCATQKEAEPARPRPRPQEAPAGGAAAEAAEAPAARRRREEAPAAEEAPSERRAAARFEQIQMPKGGAIAVATSTQEWIEELKAISVMELAERIKALEEEFGVSATAVAAAAPAAAGAGGDGAGAPRRSRRRSTSCSTPPGTRRSR